MNASPPTPLRFPPVLRRVVLVTVLGSVMTYLDATIVNVALRSLSDNLDTSLATIQWLVTAYLLGLAAVIPASGWAAATFGAKRVYVLSIAGFTVASLACGLAQNVEQLIAFRALQGAAGGLALPIATMIIVRLAGPERLARVMSISGIPTLLAPVFGPVLGGFLVEHAGWHWIFYINVPIGALTVVLAQWLVPADTAQQGGRLDVPGLFLMSLGFAALTYGLAEIGTTARVMSAQVLVSLAVGVVLIALFALHALRAAQPLVDIRLFRNKLYSAAQLTNVCLGSAVFGSVILMPLYFQIVRGEDPVATGLLLIPQGIGAGFAMMVSARLTDKLGSGRAALLGGAVSTVATVPFLVIDADSSYWFLGLAMVFRGFGIGACAIPATTAAYRVIPPAKVNDATIQIGILQRVGGSTGTALFAVVLQNELGSAGSATAQASAFGTTFWWVLATAVLATAPTLLLTAAERRAAVAVAVPENA
ncbi:DHA2 family efflux MFS transporter permease subunit [Streptomyces sp. NBC_00557]|uniref:DHA2 family efflux MFS transporter permease subunit n=1 Tax=Streptomyces sp. NBC_00557 TaxID=2975776 RepID=UPI002E81CD6A|nr:DHA2 family efflux MFS transporter permease subunit [Streptomyces sp. NBC_00557]WUC40316.1 DHA2 family efflux MFS transporter permease subunit [Streptomyces sp. NBC_00557]